MATLTSRTANGGTGRPAQPAASPPRSLRRRQSTAAYLFLAPTLLFFAVFIILPVLFATLLALSSWTGFDLADITPIGLGNFTDILGGGSTFLVPVLTNTLMFAFGAVLIALLASMVLAYCIDRLRFQGLWRTLYFLPIVTTVVAVGNVWKALYEPGGLINGALNAVGLSSVAFLTNPHTALPSIIVVQSWTAIGSAILILTAGLKAIPTVYYEAAALDGAGAWTMFRRMTLPLLRPTLLFVSITQFITALQSFALIIVMTGDGGPANSTNVAGFEMYQQAFKYGDWGTASAMAFVLFLVIFAVTLVQLWFFRRKGEDA